ncbi:WD40-repeat-containing domain protein [Phascolomyces articulosus]|uniref:WD40-repeat-containing domain protein n=1 Tax=Phascolomyces articulosus TaxID=60185 RepID=A0AAD5PH16_9FUNG|nr:WD40-repeat-containing domain protein [Phascolomyces articulosus]
MIDMDMKTPEPSMKTQIPKNINLDVLLSTIEVYDTSVIGPLGPNSLDTIMTTPGASSSSPTPTDHYLKSNENEQPMKMTRTSKRSSSKRLSKQASIHGEQSVQKPYVPWIVWQQVTWEDWAQLEVGDWLHWPFESWEVTIMEDMMKSFRTKGKKRRLDDIMFNKNAIWESIALKLPGRRAIDCSRFWEDKINNRSQTYRHPVIISCQPRDSKRPSKYELVKKSRYDGKPRVNMNKMAIWSDLKCKLSFGDGSADTLAVQILNKKGKWIKVIAASACNDQPEYNMPGNLRIWSAKNKRTVQLRGHRTSVKLADGTDQDVWHTITDVRVSNDQKLIFTSSHDKYTKIWDGTSGKMLSTLAFHEKKVHQLAVCPDTRDYILASGSADGTAVIWKLNGSGKIGDGIVCTPDSKLTKDPSIDTLVFGRGPSKGILYTGVSSGLASPMGFIQGYDIQKGKTKIYYKNMNGAVCDIDVSKTGRYIISGNHSPFDEYEGDGYVHINDTRTPESIIKARTGHPDVNLVRMSPCERYVASGSPNNETIVLDIRKPDRPLFSLKHQRKELLLLLLCLV